MERVIIDTDPGIDDSVAILLALGSPELKVEALTIVHGNLGSVEPLGENACAILENFQYSHIPVYNGVSDPINPQRTTEGVPFIHGEGNTGLKAKTKTVENENAVDFIARFCNQNPKEITIILLGPQTNLAKSLQKYPNLKNDIKRVVCMGGCIHASGNISCSSEANVTNDPEAAKIVFESGIQISLAGFNF